MSDEEGCAVGCLLVLVGFAFIGVVTTGSWLLHHVHIY